MSKVFVYGSLLFWNNHLLKKAVRIGTGQGQNLKLFDVGYDAVASYEKLNHIRGDLYEIEEKDLVSLEEYFADDKKHDVRSGVVTVWLNTKRYKAAVLGVPGNSVWYKWVPTGSWMPTLDFVYLFIPENGKDPFPEMLSYNICPAHIEGYEVREQGGEQFIVQGSGIIKGWTRRYQKNKFFKVAAELYPNHQTVQIYGLQYEEGDNIDECHIMAPAKHVMV